MHTSHTIEIALSAVVDGFYLQTDSKCLLRVPCHMLHAAGQSDDMHAIYSC
jgi:hypothetical protein